MKMRTGALVLVSALAFASVPARAEDYHPDPIRRLYRALAALNARVSKLEGNIEASDLAGTYGLVLYGSSLSPRVTNPGPPETVLNATIAHYLVSGTCTLNADGTGSCNLALSGFALTEGTWAVAPVGFGASDTFTWTYADGVMAVAFISDGSNINLNVGPGGRLLVGVQSQAHDAETNLTILTRL